ncbi:MAG: FHA domain-containing protein [Rhodocyclaceae bacterium]|nr:FHA domain-containing protein [Rhodocyclaceae bacterium]
MGQRRNQCVLYAELVGGGREGVTLGLSEIAHAVERCTNRIERVIESNSGEILYRRTNALAVGFGDCDTAVKAAAEMIERLSGMLPVMGVRVSVRIGVHYGTVSGEADADQVAAFAERLAGYARPGEALASGEAIMLLSTATRHFAGTEPIAGARAEAFDWPVYLLGPRAGMTTSLPVSSSLISPRLRIKHQDEVVIVEEMRPIILLGREQGNDVVIIDPRASRQHARIERRRDGFVLVDQSTNGTYVVSGGGAEQCARKSEVVLTGQGRVGCGFSANDIERDLVFFEII